MKNWRKILEQKKKPGQIRDYNIPEKKKRPEVPPRTTRSEEMEWIKWNLWYWCNQNAVELLEEYRFDQQRKFRFDFAIPALKIAIEYEGLMSEKSGHTTIQGYTKDTDKYNLAQRLGWKVIRFTAVNYRNLISELNKMAA